MLNPLDLLFPKKCVGCKKIGSYFCQSCIKEIKQTDLICPFCERNSVGGVTHPICRRKYGLDGLWSLGAYKKPLKESIQKLKYKWVRELAEILINMTLEYWVKKSPLILDQIKKDNGKSWVLVPVPLHPTRQNWRGFNQSALLGKIFAQSIGLDYAEALLRTRKTKPQVGLKGKERHSNLKGAFALSETSLKPNILLIDDVWTTGSTLKECCYILKRGGVKQVWGLTIAR